MKCSDIELCGSTIALVLQTVDGMDHHLDALKVFNDFVKENSQSIWKPELAKSVTSLKFSGNLLDPFTILMRGSGGSLRIIREAWSTRTIRPPPGFHIQVVGDVNRIRAHPLSRGHFIPLREAICVAIGNITEQKLLATQHAVIREIATTFGDGISQAHVPSQELLHETLGKLIKDRAVFCTGEGYHLVKKETYCTLKKHTQSPKKTKTIKCCCAKCTQTQKNTKMSRSKSCKVEKVRHECKQRHGEDDKKLLKENDRRYSIENQENEKMCSRCRTNEVTSIANHDSLKRNKFSILGKSKRDQKHKQSPKKSEEKITLKSISYEEAKMRGYTKVKTATENHKKEESTMKCEKCGNKKTSTKHHKESKKPSGSDKLSQSSSSHHGIQLHGTAVSQNEISRPQSAQGRHRHQTGNLQRSKSLRLPKDHKHKIALQQRHFSSDDPSIISSGTRADISQRSSVASATKHEYSYLHSSPTAPGIRIGSAIADYLAESNRRGNNCERRFSSSSSFSDRRTSVSSKEIQCDANDGTETTPTKEVDVKSNRTEKDDYDTEMAVKLAKKLGKMNVKMTRDEWTEYFTTKRLPNYVWEKLKTQKSSSSVDTSTYFDVAGSLETVIECGKCTKSKSSQSSAQTSSQYQNKHTMNLHEIDRLTDDSGFNSSREAASSLSNHDTILNGSLV